MPGFFKHGDQASAALMGGVAQDFINNLD